MSDFNIDYIGKCRIKIENPHQNSILLDNEPEILLLPQNEKEYNSFSILSLFKDLFFENERGNRLIVLSDIPIGHKAILAFILPPEILKCIEEDKKIIHTGKNNNYAGFFYVNVNDNKIRNIVHLAFVKLGWKNFIKVIQTHITSNLIGSTIPDEKKLIEYLAFAGDKILVPAEESKNANDALKSLLANEDKESLLLVIANYFISCLLGLRSVNVSKSKSKKYYSQKLYLLNGHGMEYIWTPDLITPTFEELYDARKLFLDGCFESAYDTGIKWLKKYETRATEESLALVYKMLGISLYNLSLSDGNNAEKNREQGIEFLKKCADIGTTDFYIYYLLYDSYRYDNDEKAAEYLKPAFAHDYAKAVIETGFEYLNGNRIFDDISEDLLLEKICRIIDNESETSKVDVGECLYLRGMFLKNRGDHSEASKDFEAAAQKGNEKARLEISRKKRTERHAFPSFSNECDAPCCYTNNLSGNNFTVISTFPNGKWALFTSAEKLKKDINTVQDIDEFIELQKIGKSEFCRPRLIFLFMSENEESNLNDCLILLDKLFNIVLKLPMKQKMQIIDAIDIYVSAKYETATLLIDANISDMGKDIYFKIHIADENRDTAHKLLCDAPLFLPALNGNKKENFTNVVLFGDSEMNYSFIKESIACAYLGEVHPISIVLLSEYAKKFEKRLHQECPGIYRDHPQISCIKPRFIECNIEETDFPACIYGNAHTHESDNEILRGDESDSAIAEALLNGNYFIVDYADDLKNIRFSAELRTWLLRSRGTFDRAPFIAVKCADEQTSYLASHLTLSGQPSGNAYYNQYDLFPIGVLNQTYSYSNIIENNVLNDFAFRIHKSYYGNDERSAKNDFYSYSYNADSSLSTAIGLCYRLFAAGAAFKDKEDYLNFSFFTKPEVISKYNEILSYGNKDKIELLLAVLEQSRWNGFMLSRGWESADVSQVQVYKEQSTGFAHKHTLAKLHPFIREWNDLDNSDLLRILNILKSKYGYDKHPQQTTIKSIKDTLSFFKTPLAEEK